MACSSVWPAVTWLVGLRVPGREQRVDVADAVIYITMI